MCKDKFKPTSNTQTCCSMKCAIDYSKSTKGEKHINKNKALDKKELKNNIVGIPELKKILELQINTIARILDSGSGCISCGGDTTPQGGHYHSVGANGSIRFNLLNIYLQDYNCNCAKGGNIHNFDLGLIKMYGKEHWEMVKFELPLKYPLLKPSKQDLFDAISKAKELVKNLKAANITYSVDQRIRLRNEYNKFIGLYI